MLEVARMVSGWLGDATYGVAAKLAAASFDGSDTAPTGTLVIGDETQNAKASLGQYPGDWSIAVQLQPMDTLDGEAATYTHEYNVPLLLRFSRKDSNAANATRDLLYTLRATVQSIEALFNASIAAATTARLRNNVQASVIVSMGQALTREQREDNLVTAALSVTIRARDLVA